MPSLHLTKSTIDELSPGASDVVYWDDALAGFGLKVTPRGRKVFIVLYRTKDGFSRLRKYTIGPYGQITLTIARITAQKVLAARLEGKDPTGEKRRLRQKVIRDAIEDVVADYRVRHVNAIRSASETNRILEREILNRWKGRSIHEITRQDILKLLDEIVDRGLAWYGQPGLHGRSGPVQLGHPQGHHGKVTMCRPIETLARPIKRSGSLR